ncbi:MAG: hypothetical protein NZ873_02470 [Crenarchaeota archaeon]|nr:hypothetical protein [Thermoproteota archaeon]
MKSSNGTIYSNYSSLPRDVNNKISTNISCSVQFDPIFGDFVISGSISIPVSSTVSIWYSHYEIWHSLFHKLPEAWELLGNTTSNSDGSYCYRVSIIDVGFAGLYKTSWSGTDEYHGTESNIVSIPIENSNYLLRNFIMVRFFMVICMIASERTVNFLRNYKEKLGRIVMLLLDSSLLTIFYLLVFYNVALMLKLIFAFLNIHYTPSLSPEILQLLMFMNIIALLDALFYYYPNILGERVFGVRRKILLSILFTTGFLISFSNVLIRINIASMRIPNLPIKYVAEIACYFTLFLFIVIYEGYPELLDRKIGRITLHEIFITTIISWAFISFLLFILT